MGLHILYRGNVVPAHEKSDRDSKGEDDMETALIAFSSSTSANRLKRLAQEAGIGGVTLGQTPRAISENGCTYSLRAPLGALDRLLSISAEYHITHGRVYRETTDEFGRKFYQRV